MFQTILTEGVKLDKQKGPCFFSFLKKKTSHRSMKEKLKKRHSCCLGCLLLRPGFPSPNFMPFCHTYLHVTNHPFSSQPRMTF